MSCVFHSQMMTYSETIQVICHLDTDSQQQNDQMNRSIVTRGVGPFHFSPTLTHPHNINNHHKNIRVNLIIESIISLHLPHLPNSPIFQQQQTIQRYNMVFFTGNIQSFFMVCFISNVMILWLLRCHTVGTFITVRVLCD